jgi:hypothetical protein
VRWPGLLHRARVAYPLTQRRPELHTRPVRLALFEEYGDALLRVGHQCVHGHNVAGMFIGGMLVGFDLSVERPLAAADDQRTRAYDLFGDPLSVFLEFVGWQDGVDQAPFCRGARINPLAREQQLQCALAPDGPAHGHHRRLSTGITSAIGFQNL